ncbi:MAG: FtsX-like permease family protein, partial [Planctomycetota bacterium]
MYLHNLFWISLKDLFTKISRLFFLSLGVAVGTCALTFLLCLHSGLKKVVLDEIIQKLPFNQLKIRPISQKPKSLVEFTFKTKDESLNLVREKLDIIRNTPGVKDIWPERTLNFPILFTLKEVKVSMFTVPDITMPTTIFGVHPDLIQNNPELYRKFKYNPDPTAEVPIVCSSKLFEMMNDTSLAQGKIGDLLSSIINENTFLDKRMLLRIGFSTKDEQRISEGFEHAKQREDRIKESEIAGIAKFMRNQLTSAISEGYESDRPWIQRKARIIGFTDEVPVVGLSVPLGYVEEWLKIRSEYELDHYCGAVIELNDPLPKEETLRQNKINEFKKMFFWEEPPIGVPETRIQIENESRIRIRNNPFLPASSAQWFQSHVPPLVLEKPRWNWLESQKTIQKVFWEQTLDFPAAMRVLRQEEPVYLPTDLHGIDPELLGDQASLLEYNRTGNAPVPAVVSPYFFQRLRELGMDEKSPELYSRFQNLETLKVSPIYLAIAYDPFKISAMEEELQYLIKQEENPSKSQFIFRELLIVGISDRVPDIGISVPKAFLERAYRWKYPQLKTEDYKYSGLALCTQNLDLQDIKAVQQLEKGVLSNFQMSWNEENTATLKWIAPNQLNFRHFYWKPSQFEDFFKSSAQGLQLRGGSFASFEFKDQTKNIYLERKSNFPIKMALPENQENSTLSVTLVGISPELLQDPSLKEMFSKSGEGTLPMIISPTFLEKLQHLQLVPEHSPWKPLFQEPQQLIGKTLYLGIENVSGDWKLSLKANNTLPPVPVYDKDDAKIKREPFVWKAKIVGISLDASPAGISVPAKTLEELIRWVYPTKVYENYSGVTVITNTPEDTASIAKQIREHPSLKLDILTETETAEMLSTLRTYLIIATIIIGIILFLVAAVSIFNGLTLSVLEQSKKIGIYRAIGAKRSDIVFIFMVEAIAVGLIGGFLGLGAGYTAIHYVDPFIISTVPEFAYKNIKFWDTLTGREICTLSGQPGPIHTLALSSDGIYLASGTPHCSIRIWDFRSKGEMISIAEKIKRF